MVIIWINEKLINLTRRTKQTNYIESEAGRSRFDSIFFEEKKSTREFVGCWKTSSKMREEKKIENR